jgi:hypothetical protein
MVHEMLKRKNRLLVFCIYPALFILVLSLCIPYNVYSQDLSDVEQQTAIMQYTLKYRFGKDLKVGDMVKYTAVSNEGEEPSVIELKVSNKKDGTLIIDENTGGMTIHYQINPVKMELISITGTDNHGGDINIKPLSDERFEEIVGIFKSGMRQQGSFAQFVAWEEGSEAEDVNTPAGGFKCIYLRPKYAETYATQIKSYEESLRSQGKSEAEIKKMTYGNEPRLYFSNDVPKLLPMNIAMGWMPWIEAFEGVNGGLVECRHMAPLKLAGYKK